MHILSQILNQKQTDLFFTAYNEILAKLTSTIYQTPSVFNYVELIENTGDYFRTFALDTLKLTLQEMDQNYRKSLERKMYHHVKQTRSRTLITLFGELSYTRTEYVEKSTNHPFCYVDWKMGLRKKDRYDPCVQALMIEAYADHNSMIKVGKLVGDRISGVFNTKPNRDTAICRQTVFNILQRHKDIKVKIVRAQDSPKILHIMVDEKFVALQRENIRKAKQMVKAAVVFEDIVPIKLKSGIDSTRNKVVNKTIVSNCDGFWEELIDVLYQKYDMSQVKQIYLMGDGAGWIKTGVAALTTATTKVSFGIDSFHFHQAINRITKDTVLYHILLDYCRNNQKNDFKKVVAHILDNSPDREELITANFKYLFSNWSAYQTTINEISLACPMEQAISHILASPFTSVPKAYGKQTFPIYLNNRIIQQNGYDLRALVLNDISEKLNNYSELDFSIFEKKTYPDNPTIRQFNKNIITQF